MPFDVKRAEQRPHSGRKAKSRKQRNSRWHVLQPAARITTATMYGLVLYAALPAPVLAQTTASAQGQNVQKNYVIPAGPLAPALRSLASSANVLLTFTDDQTDGKRTAGVSGQYTPQGALSALLAGTGLQAAPLEGGGYILQNAPAGVNAATRAETTLPMVEVSGAAENGSADAAYRVKDASVGVLGDKAWKDTPFSMEVISRDLMSNQQSASMIEALRNDASVTPTTNGVGGLASQVFVRGIGLDLTNGRKIDGLNAFHWSGDIPLEHFEQIQLLKGAGGFLYGFGQPGGMVNFISKRPTDTPVRSILTSVTDSGTVLAATDLGGRFGTDDRFGYRLNVVGEDGDSYVKDGDINRHSGSLALDWRVAPNLVWSADVLAMHRKATGSTSWGLFPNTTGGTSGTLAQPPDPISGNHRIYSPFTYYETHVKTWGTTVDWGFADGWNARLAYRGSTMAREYYNGAIYANAAGNYTEELYSGTDNFKTYDLQAIVTGKVKTGLVSHDLAFGASRGIQRGYTSSIFGYAVLGSGNLDQPGHFNDPGLDPAPADTLTGDIVQRSIFASDTLHIGDKWDVVLGLRHASIVDEPNDYDRSETTPTVAVVFKPTPSLSTYVSYIESLEQGATAPSAGVSNPNEVFSPLVSKQVELGVKTEHQNWSGSAAIFEIKRGLAYRNGDVFTQDGETRFRGLELALKARIATPWMVGASALFLNSKNIEAADDILGLRAAGAPREQFTLYTEYQIPTTNWTLTAGMQHYGSRPIDAANTVSLPSYTLLDAGLRYTTKLGGTLSTWRLNIDNLTDKAYWQTSSSYLTQGAPRTVKLSAQFDF